MTTIYLIRHAEAEGNLCRRMHGQYDSNLTPHGLRQLTALKSRFLSVQLDACYCSDLTRAENTAQAICDACGLEYRVDPGFREIGVGKWEDVPFGYLNTFHGLEMTMFGRDPVNWAVEGSETFRQYTTRFLQSLEAAVLRHEGGTIAVVSHSVIMRNVLTLLCPELKIPHSANTAVSCLTYESGTYAAVYLNDCSHMEPSLRTSSKQKWWQQDGAQGNDTFWYKEGMTNLEGLQPIDSQIVYTVMEDQRPVGLLGLSEEGGAGRIDYMGLIPGYRGFGLAIQLIGHAISVFRGMGKKQMCIRAFEEPALLALGRKLSFQHGKNGDLIMDLTLRVQPF